VDFIDVYAGEFSEEKMKRAEELEIKIAPGHFSLLISKNRREVRKKRKDVDFVAAIVNKRQELNSLLTDVYYDFFIIPSTLRLGKRSVRMAKRYETGIAVPLSPAFSLKPKLLARISHNLKLVEEIGAILLLCSGAETPEDLRSGRDLACIGVLLGLSPDYARKAVRHFPNFILERNRERKKQAAWGVEVIQ